MRKKFYKGIVFLFLASFLVGCGKVAEAEPPGDVTQQQSEMVSEITSERETEVSSEIVVETEVTEEIPEPVVTTVTVTATGDCALGALQYHEYSGSFRQYYDSKGDAYFFENFKEVFEGDDLTLINLECVFTTAKDRVEKTFNIKGAPEYTGILTSSSVEAVSLGNNHSQDYGPQSLQDTKDALDAAGVLYAINDTISYFTTKDGMVVAMVSANITGAGNERDQYLLNGVTEARNNGADLVIACCHWGIEKVHYTNDYQENLGHALIDNGADLVVGNHPHVLQGVEEYKGKIILYSLGNFSFGANRDPEDKDTAVYQQTFTFVDGVLQTDITAKIIPARLSGHDTYNDYQPAIASEKQAKVIISRMNEYSEPYGGVFFDAQGNLSIKSAE